MKFSVHIATVADIPALSIVSRAAFKDDPCVGYLARNVPPDMMQAYQCLKNEWKFQTSSLNGLKMFKAVDEETGEIVGVSRWQFPYSLSEEQSAEKEKLRKDSPAKPEGFNRELENEILAAIDKFQEEWVDESTHFGLAVSPDHQRLGLGSLLVRDGLDKVDEAGARAFLEAAPVAVPLYLKHGFRTVDEISIDMGPHGGVGIVSYKCMMREPGGG
ncbi:MAG: hypothetical protein Q9161_008249 [Pseudevernia consocians]